MEMDRRLEEWDDELEAALAEYKAAKRIEDKAQGSLGEIRSRYRRTESMYEKAKAKAAEVRLAEADERRRAAEAQLKARDAQLKGLPGRGRFEAEGRRWEQQRRRSEQQIIRWQDEVRRKERELRSAAGVVNPRIAEVGKLAKESQYWEQRVKFLSLRGGGVRAPEQPAPDGDFRPFGVTEDATGALNSILKGMRHDPGQALRVAVNPQGNITLVLDAERPGDAVVWYQGTAVLLIESPLPAGLQGTTLDVNETPDGPRIVFSR